MQLSEFIRHRMEIILTQWESFAATLQPEGSDMTSRALRDHAQQILEAIAADLSEPQSRQAQVKKSKGWSHKDTGVARTAAETHAVLRAKSGFDINQLVAEYRALRASVLRLWMDTCKPDSSNVEDVIRFNEGIDQAVAESIEFFSVQTEQARNLLLGMLGHDMRSPLNTIQTTASYLTALNAGDRVSAAASRLMRSGAAIKMLLEDLVDFNRTQLGLGITIEPSDVDLAALFEDEMEQLRGAHPESELKLEVSGTTRGHWDGARLQQVLRNLVTNALKYGDEGAPVRVTLVGDATDVRLEVTNRGPAIDPPALDQIFDPLKRGPAPPHDPLDDSGLGLGLYIVREVTRAHGGRVDAHSRAGYTVFVVQLPRQKPDAGG